MNDAYAEWIVKRKQPAYTYVVIPVMIILCIVSAFLALTSNVFFMIIAALVFFGTYLVFRNLKVEYEYIYVTGQISFDKILGRSKRKRVILCETENILVIAPVDTYLVKDQVNANTKVLDLTSKMPDAKIYALIHQSGSERVKILFEPNDKVLECLKQAAPRKVTI